MGLRPQEIWASCLFIAAPFSWRLLLFAFWQLGTQARDTKLAAPTLLLPSIQVNIRAGRFPEAESNGVRYLKIPVKARAGLA